MNYGFIGFFLMYLCSQGYSIEKKFPKDFIFGASTAAYQIEGGWNSDNKSSNVWDYFIHENPEIIKDKSNGDSAADSYNLFEEDLKVIKELKLDFYSFSISWNRILPTNDLTEINEVGINYYNSVIDKLLENNVQPMVIMHYFDLPIDLYEIGGYNNKTFFEIFESYSDVLFENFGDRVKYWITFNDPFFNCMLGYRFGIFPTQLKEIDSDVYYCLDSILKAHAKAYRLYKEKYLNKFGGKIGISLSSYYFYSDDKESTDLAIQHQLGVLANPIYSNNGGYPEIILDDIPFFQQLSDEWINVIKGSADFFGLSYFTSGILNETNNNVNNQLDTPVSILQSLQISADPKWKKSSSEFLYNVPDGLTELLRWIRNTYNNPEVIVTANGWSDVGEIYDDGRVTYLEDHLEAILKSIEDGCNVTGYAVWSLIDGFQWFDGYTQKYGLYSVNYTSIKRERIPKISAEFYKRLLSSRKLLF